MQPEQHAACAVAAAGACSRHPSAPESQQPAGEPVSEADPTCAVITVSFDLRWKTPVQEWHYTIEGPKDSPYEGGLYHGKLTFPIQYPYKVRLCCKLW